MRFLFSIINPRVSHTSAHLRGFKSDAFSYAGRTSVPRRCLWPHTSAHLRGFRSDGFSYAGRMEVWWNRLHPHTSVQYEARLKRVVADIHANLDVEELRQRLPDRLQTLVDAKGDRLKY